MKNLLETLKIFTLDPRNDVFEVYDIDSLFNLDPAKKHSRH
jgi:hypothetical protein